MIRRHRLAALLLAALSLVGVERAAVAEQLVLGSFRDRANADHWATELTRRLHHAFLVERVHRDDGVWFRVRTGSLQSDERAGLEADAEAQGLATWVIHGSYETPGTVTSSSSAPAAAAATGLADADAGMAEAVGRPSPATPERRSGATVSKDLDLGLQQRTYTHPGTEGQGRFQPSVSARFEYHRAWDHDRSSFTFTPFVRLDGEDHERTHADIRELFWSHVGTDWEIHVGARQIFWGVTEFEHLDDIINQTDLVENIDGEDKLGQPMIQLSLVRDWGIVDVFALTGFRERTFPGEDGRLRSVLPVDTRHARYESGAGRHRIDGAIRWSHHVGPLSFGIYHFSGTSRDPRFITEVRNGKTVLVPEYDVIDQTGLDAQAITGDWAWKLEAITRSGLGDRYYAYTTGFERTLVGVFGTRSDLGVVMEYMYDERDKAAYDTLYEHDLALGARWRANDLADTTALAGFIHDVKTDEYVLSLEASRRLGASWMAVLEGRVFGGANAVGGWPAALSSLDTSIKSQALQDDDYLQLELTRYF